MSRIWPSVSLLLALFSSIPASWSQVQYEKAKVQLDAQVIESTQLLIRPESGSKVVYELSANSQLVIIGRLGSWFQVEAGAGNRPLTGWIPSSSLRILGPSQKPLTPPPISAPSFATPHKNTSDESSKPLRSRLIPNVGYALGANQFPNQYRGGIDLVFEKWPKTEIGVSAEVGFHKLVFIGFGPTIVHRLSWPLIGPFKPAIFGGFSGYVTSSNTNNDVFWGPRFGGEFSYSMPGSNQELEAIVRVSTDVLLFGSKTVSVPVQGALGLAIHF